MKTITIKVGYGYLTEVLTFDIEDESDEAIQTKAQQYLKDWLGSPYYEIIENITTKTILKGDFSYTVDAKASIKDGDYYFYRNQKGKFEDFTNSNLFKFGGEFLKIISTNNPNIML